MGRIDAVNTSHGGVPKLQVFEAFVSEAGVSLDAHAHPEFHGGPDRAVVLYSLEIIQALQAEGHPIGPGTTGENLTVSGLDWARMVPGIRIRAGSALLEISKYATPCRTIAGSFLEGVFTRIGEAQHPGWSRVCARVIEAGLVQPGDSVTIEG